MSYSEALEQQIRLTREWSGALPGWDGDMVRRLPYADTYWVDGNVQALLNSGANTLPHGMTIERTTPPSVNGFVWLSRPISVKTNNGTDSKLWGIQWMPAHINPSIDGIRMGLVHDKGDGSFDAYAILSYITNFYGEVGPGFLSTWGFETSLRAAAELDIKYRQSNMSDDDLTTATATKRLWGAFCLFVQQRILVTRHAQAERHARKRLEQQSWTATPVVRVVELRRKEHVGNSHGVQPVEREWSCQWLVRGHWRQQWYAKAQRNQPIWITPYVKGPEDKPLRPPRATVFAVVR